MINVQLASSVLIVPVCFINACPFPCLFALLNIREHDIESSRICQYTPAPYSRHHHQKDEWERQIKRKVQQQEYRQISGHATIRITIVRVCTMIVYGNLEVRVCFRSRSMIFVSLSLCRLTRKKDPIEVELASLYSIIPNPIMSSETMRSIIDMSIFTLNGLPINKTGHSPCSIHRMMHFSHSLSLVTLRTSPSQTQRLLRLHPTSAVEILE